MPGGEQHAQRQNALGLRIMRGAGEVARAPPSRCIPCEHDQGDDGEGGGRRREEEEEEQALQPQWEEEEEEEGGEPPAVMHVTMTILLQFSSKTTVTRHPPTPSAGRAPRRTSCPVGSIIACVLWGGKNTKPFFLSSGVFPLLLRRLRSQQEFQCSTGGGNYY